MVLENAFIRFNIISIMIQQNGRGFKKQTGKPVNINISFTINPKNIMNHPMGQNSLPHGRKVSKQADFYTPYNNAGGIISCSKIPELMGDAKSKDKNLQQVAQKNRRGMKRNSVDESSFREAKMNEYNKSLTLRKSVETNHFRKSSTKSKKNSDNVNKKHNKTASNFAKCIEKYPVNSVMIDGGTVQNFDTLKKNLKKMINKMVGANSLSKKSLPLQFSVNQSTSRKNIQRKKNKKRSPKKGKSEAMLYPRAQSQNRKELIEKLTSFKSMNNSLFMSEGEQDNKPAHRRSIIVNTDQSIECIDQIHQIQASQRFRKLDDIPNNNESAKETINIIETYIALLNEHVNYEGQVVSQREDRPIAQQFEEYQRNHQELMEKREQQQLFKEFQSHELPGLQKRVNNQRQQIHKSAEISSEQFYEKKIKEDEIRPFCSSQMTKEQQLINELERIKLNQLKKHQVQKWQQLLTFMKKSMEKGESDSEQILETVYHFLQKTRNDLQEELQSPQKIESEIDTFTNKLTSKNQNEYQSNYTKIQKEQENEENKQFEEISSMSFKDEDYQEQNEELKVLNLEMIDSALKNRYKNLVDRRDKQLDILEEKRNCGKISEIDFILEKDKLDKWTKQETLSISQARKNIWNGYNQAKGILQKSARSKLFQEEFHSNKKKSMMKCLSQDYLLKKNIDFLRADRKMKEKSPKNSDESDSLAQRSDNDRKQSVESEKDQHIHQKKSEEYGHGLNQRSIETPQSSNKDDQSMNKEVVELDQLKEEEDLGVIEEKLKDLKQKRLKEDEDKKELEEGLDSPNMSYEQVANQLHESYSDEEMNIIRNEFDSTGKYLPSQNNMAQEVEVAEIKKEEANVELEKFKYLCAEDKEDIFEFIFLDLSIELYQQPCTNNKIMNTINNYVAHAKRQANKKKGVKTNLNVVKEYLKRFSGFIEKSRSSVLNTLDEPVGPTAIQMLRYMHENEDEEPRDEEEPPSTLIIPSHVFDEFEKQLLPTVQFEVYYQNDGEKQKKRVQFLKSVLHIHNKALYDSMNEYLDMMRPFGIWGKPFPWKKSSSFLRPSSAQQKQEKLKKSTEKIAEYCSYVCGLLVDKEQSLVGNAKLSDEYIEQIKEDRLSRMLATQLMQNEQRWLFYDDEQTEVLVQLSNALYRILLKEAAQEVFNIVKEKK